jgi:hypothetical protein
MLDRLNRMRVRLKLTHSATAARRTRPGHFSRYEKNPLGTRRIQSRDELV